MPEYTERFFAVDFKDDVVSMTDFKVGSEKIGMGDDQLKVYSLLDVDDPASRTLRPYADINVNNTVMPQDLLSDLSTLRTLTPSSTTRSFSSPTRRGRS